MKPPTVKELMDPRSQSTTKIRANIDTTYLHGLEGPSAHVLKRRTCEGVNVTELPCSSGRTQAERRTCAPLSNVLRQGSGLELGDPPCCLFPSYWSSRRPFRIATDEMSMAATMNSLRFVARSFASPRACQTAQRSSKP